MKPEKKPAFSAVTQWRFFAIIGFVTMLPYAVGLFALSMFVTLSSLAPGASLEMRPGEIAGVIAIFLTISCTTLGLLMAILFPPEDHGLSRWAGHTASLLLIGVPGLAMAVNLTDSTFMMACFLYLILFNLCYAIHYVRLGKGSKTS